MRPTNNIKNPIKVYGTIAGELKKYIDKYSVDYITFSAVSSSTHDLYSAFAKRIYKILGGKKIFASESGHWTIYLK